MRVGAACHRWAGPTLFKEAWVIWSWLCLVFPHGCEKPRYYTHTPDLKKWRYFLLCRIVKWMFMWAYQSENPLFYCLIDTTSQHFLFWWQTLWPGPASDTWNIYFYLWVFIFWSCVFTPKVILWNEAILLPFVQVSNLVIKNRWKKAVLLCIKNFQIAL